MTIENVMRELERNDIYFSVRDYEKEEDYLKHVYLFPNAKNPNNCKVRTLVVKCPNGHKNVELQFNDEDGEYVFNEMLFGEYCFELFDTDDEYLIDEILSNIFQIISEQLVIIIKNDLDKKRWVSDACYSLNDEDKTYGEPAFLKALEKIERPKNSIEKKISTKKQYEIYSFNSYQCIIR